MRLVVFLAACGLALGQPADPAYEPLSHAYQALRAKDYDTAIAGFLRAAQADPRRPSIRKELAYTYLKTGENELARDQFRAAMELDPQDTQVAMEYAFLCYETKEQALARRIFDRVRKTPNAVAEQAFQNIDAPLAQAIDRWKKAIEMGADNFSAHFELATFAEQRDDLPTAAEHYQKAWRLLPDRRSVLVDLGRVWKALGRTEDANAAFLAASRGGEPRAAEMARALLPARYPYVPEFRRAIELDPANLDLRRELGYLLLQMDREPEAEIEFRKIVELAPNDLVSVTQLGFLLYARGERTQAAPLFDRVLAGQDQDLANRVRALLRKPQLLQGGSQRAAGSVDAKLMAEHSLKAGYLYDAAKYLTMAHEADPADYEVDLKLGWTYNILHQDPHAFHWFDLARKSSDSKIKAEATRAWRNLRGSFARFRTSAWFYPIYSTRWHDLFAYAQIKTDLRTGTFFRPYISLRFVGDTRRSIGASFAPQYLSESSFILGAGVATAPWHGITLWGEAGNAANYLTLHMLPDYRGGVSVAEGVGHTLRGESPGGFADMTLDAVYFSRFGNDTLVYSQNRVGYTAGPKQFRVQIYWNGNVTIDSQRQAWANFGETGPGIRVSGSFLPPSMFFTFNAMGGVYLFRMGHLTGAAFTDYRFGLWYAFTH